MAGKKSKTPLRNVGLKMPVQLWEAVEHLAERNYRTATAEVRLALEKHLSQEGLWPPKDRHDGRSQKKRR